MPAAPTLADRVAALERQLAALVRASAPAVGGRVSKHAAAARLCCSVRQVSRYASRGLLAPLPKPAGASKNAATYFDAANVAALVESEAAAREWVSRRKFVPLKRRA